ncbi:hypothetical protein COCOR_00796 [Corallococcus coralloides DSM 2259]|uniref:Uncharacterized protein n=1 Tax=Corallococcus coralloides (strain ATCC 25202 / DSM 2259 / NBRC 100086 / M2) TaxID=1144275 RepID=H8MIR1_CORCM|nr:hypothetical protein [Corallococcus coralloides]AFE03711.1 hypothetical protein COCOR_00796 [Corallococcus coralloides DSM 2259]
MKTFLQTLLSQVPGIALGITGGVALTFATLESRVERMLDAKLEAHFARLRPLVQSRPEPAPVVMQAQDSREDLRLIREHLAVLAARQSLEALPPTELVEEARPAPTPEQMEASRQGQQVLADAITRGRWTDDDQRRFHQALSAGPREEAEAMERSLSLAINSGQLRPALGEER